MIDMKGKPCQRPGCNGHYDETDLYCDWDGVVKCTACGHTIPSWGPETDPLLPDSYNSP